MTVATRVRLRTLAIPNEHGAWAFLLEPTLLGLLLAPTVAGAALAVAAVAALLAQHPLSLFLADRRRGKSYPRTRWAAFFAALYGLTAAVAAATAWSLADAPQFLLPFVVAAPLAVVELYFDSRNRGRQLLPELCGALALNSLAPAIALLGGLDGAVSVALWAALALRTLPSIHYVRTRLRLDRGQPTAPRAAVAVQLAAALAAGGMAIAGFLPAWAPIVYASLAVRALFGLSPWRRRVAPKVIGFTELAAGMAVVAVLAITFRGVA